jgi:hypothetical protein
MLTPIEQSLTDYAQITKRVRLEQTGTCNNFDQLGMGDNDIKVGQHMEHTNS